MRIGTFRAVDKKLVIALFQLAPEDCSYEEENYDGEDPSRAVKEMEDAGYKVCQIWWRDIQGDAEKLHQIINKFHEENKVWGLH